MPDRYLEPEERNKIFEIIARKYVKTMLILAVSISIVVACAVTIPTALLLNQDTKRATKIISTQNCYDIRQLRDEFKKVLIIANPPHPTPLEQKRINDFDSKSFAVLNGIHCRTS